MEIYLGGMRVRHAAIASYTAWKAQVTSLQWVKSVGTDQTFFKLFMIFFYNFFTIINRYFNVNLLMNLITAYITKIFFILSLT